MLILLDLKTNLLTGYVAGTVWREPWPRTEPSPELKRSHRIDKVDRVGQRVLVEVDPTRFAQRDEIMTAVERDVLRRVSLCLDGIGLGTQSIASRSLKFNSLGGLVNV
jgi:hypothetical protein